MTEQERNITLRNALATAILNANISEYQMKDFTVQLYWEQCKKVDKHTTFYRLQSAIDCGKIELKDIEFLF